MTPINIKLGLNFIQFFQPPNLIVLQIIRRSVTRVGFICCCNEIMLLYCISWINSLVTYFNNRLNNVTISVVWFNLYWGCCGAVGQRLTVHAVVMYTIPIRGEDLGNLAWNEWRKIEGRYYKKQVSRIYKRCWYIITILHSTTINPYKHV